MASALIGHTGFIGSNLRYQRLWDKLYNSVNVRELAGNYDLIVCAGAPGTKWRANADPEADLAAIKSLIAALWEVRAKRFFLISTADVFPQPCDADEDTKPRPTHPYGAHRLMLEVYCRLLFPGLTIVRLPGVVGPGLSKNARFDLDHERGLENLNPNSVYQWYNVSNLWEDIEDRTEPIIHLCPLPVRLRDTAARLYPHLVDKLNPRAIRYVYNLRTKYEESE